MTAIEPEVATKAPESDAAASDASSPTAPHADAAPDATPAAASQSVFPDDTPAQSGASMGVCPQTL